MAEAEPVPQMQVEEEKKTSQPNLLLQPANPIIQSSEDPFEQDLLRAHAAAMPSIRQPPSIPLFRPTSFLQRSLNYRLGIQPDFEESFPMSSYHSFGASSMLMHDYSDPTRDKFRKLYEALTSGENDKMVQATLELASEIAMTQETSISAQTLNQFIDPLISCLKTPSAPEIIGTSYFF